MSSKKKQKMINMGLYLAIACFMTVYVFQIIEYHKIGFDLEKKEEKIESLKKTNATLKLSASKNLNFTNIEEKMRERGYDKAQGVDYLSINQPSLATK